MNWDTDDNLTAKEREALDTLRKNDQLIIKPSDKGGNLVLMDHPEYRTMCTTILQDRTTYEVLEGNPLEDFKSELRLILEEAISHKLISPSEFDFMLPKCPLVATFYTLPKVHKGCHPLKGRPIVSGVDSLTQNCGIYVDQILRPFVTSIPSYLRDTSDLLLKLEGMHLGQDVWLASIDIEALYSSIPHEAGIEGVRYFLQQRSVACWEHNEFVLNILRYILTHNAFSFDGKHFHQLRGTAMGCPYDRWWDEFISIWYRYIDDVFLVWTGSKEGFEAFMRHLNVNNVGLRFTSEIVEKELAFLDLKIEKEINGGLATSIYRKPTSTNSLLHWQSHHPASLKRGIPKGQFLRARRNCSGFNMFKSQAGDMYNRFNEKGYPRHVLNRAYDAAKKADRQTLLQNHKREDSDDVLRIIGTFDAQHQEVRRIFSRHWDVLRFDPDLRDRVGERPNITFRKGRSLRDMLVHSQYQRPRPRDTWLHRRPCGFFKCGDCSLCKWMRPCKKFQSSTTGKIFYQREFSNCKTEGVVYVASCSCPKDYVGKTKREFRRRVGEHMGDIR
ncbi:unnamed protein product [Ranitomeya imitator]|uniref:Helix-turn-helix domain-containing protein n=1 Tax=Ranitomeya imitator TaxID=111125 RepID=A0ABN9LLS0_9NEOB|nr:unnamed protein product [Ranitomeya imitator]